MMHITLAVFSVQANLRWRSAVLTLKQEEAMVEFELQLSRLRWLRLGKGESEQSRKKLVWPCFTHLDTPYIITSADLVTDV